uniref:Uncharacterized protein n=1 Tax=Lepeophtheirus salmonis TaxID=72036 RepID=A0A0K2UXL1_LEPSM
MKRLINELLLNQVSGPLYDP